MEVEQQGLYLLTIVCSLISLLACCFILLTCGVTSLWKRSSIRLIMYLTLLNILTCITLLLPTYNYEFICSLQTHMLHFCLVGQLILSSLFLHFSYHKTVLEQHFTQKTELVYLGIVILPALLTSIPPFISENVGNNCWENNHTPLQNSVASGGFLFLYVLSVLASFACFMGVNVHLSLFPKGFQTEEFDQKLEKMRMMGKFSLMNYAIGMILFIYASLELIDRHRRGMDFIAMFCQASCGAFTLMLFISTQKVKKGMRGFFKGNSSVSAIITEDVMESSVFESYS